MRDQRRFWGYHQNAYIFVGGEDVCKSEKKSHFFLQNMTIFVDYRGNPYSFFSLRGKRQLW